MGGTNNPGIIDKISYPTYQSGYAIYTNGTGNSRTVSFSIGSGKTLTSSASSPLNAGVWYHVAATYDGLAMRIYINGVLSGTLSTAGQSLQTTVTLYIGNGGYWNDGYFNGLIDEVRIWNIARTQAQIQANMNRILEGNNEVGLVGYWRFNESSGTIAFDQSPYGNNGTLGNTARFALTSIPNADLGELCLLKTLSYG